MSDARAYAQRNQRGNDWFSHDATTTTAAAPPKVEPAAPETKVEDSSQAAGRAQMIKPKCDSNNWFKHEHNNAATGTGAAETASAAIDNSAVPAEPALTTAAAAVPPAAAAAENPSKVSREGDVYSKRDKAGSSASWFSHDHTDGGAEAHKGPRVTTSEGGANASRMRGESENWFNYDQNKPDQPVQTGRAANRSRAQGDSMKGIFNMD